jgi:hypothetical protein
MRVCVTAMVDLNYQKYLPTFLFFLYKAYPEYAFRLITPDGVSEKSERALEHFKSLGMDLGVIPVDFLRKNSHRIMATLTGLCVGLWGEMSLTHLIASTTRMWIFGSTVTR